jgi:hypothetical protein
MADTDFLPAGLSAEPFDEGASTTDVVGRLGRLRTLRDGWLDGKGKAPGQIGLDWLARRFDRDYPADLPLPHVYPTAEGGVQLEWSLPPAEISLEIDLSARLGTWHLLDLRTEKDESHQLALDEAGGWSWLTGRIRSLVRRQG